MSEYIEAPGSEQTQREEEQIGFYPGTMPSSVDMKATSDFLMWTLDSLEKIERIEHELKGEIPFVTYDKKGTPKIIWNSVAGRRIMNDRGVQKIIFMIKPFFDKEVAMANIGTKENMGLDEAHHITKLTMHVINDAVYRNIKEWELDETMYPAFISYLNNEIYLALTRVKGGGIVKVIKPTYHRFETYMPGERKKKGLFSFLRRQEK